MVAPRNGSTNGFTRGPTFRVGTYNNGQPPAADREPAGQADRQDAPMPLAPADRAAPCAAPVAQPVGRMQFLVRRRQGEATVADVELSIFTDDRYIDLEGIVVREPRPGFVTMEIPPLEKWEKPMRWLLPEQRERIQTPEFFQLLQTHVTRKYLALAPVATTTAGGQQPQPAAGAKPPDASAPDRRGPAQGPSGP